MEVAEVVGRLSRIVTVVVLINAALGSGTVGAEPAGGPVTLSTTAVDSYIDGPIYTLAEDSGSVVYPTVDEDLVVVPIGGGPSLQLSPDTLPSNTLIYPTISPDSQTVLFEAWVEATNESTLHTVPIGGGPVTGLAHPVIAPPTRVSGEFTPDSTRIVVSVFDGTYTTLHTSPRAGGPMVDYDSGQCVGGSLPHRISPDSQSLVLGCSTFMYSTAIDGGPLLRLPSGSNAQRIVVDSYEITPDSATVIYLADIGVATPVKLFSVPLDGGAPTLLSHDMADDVDSFLLSDNGATIIYTAGSRFWAVAGGGSPIELTPTLPPMATIQYLQQSPDGAYVTYYIYLNGVLSLHSARTSDGTTVMLSPPGAQLDGANTAMISPDSETVLYRSGSNDEERLYSVPISGGTPTNISGDLVPGSPRVAVAVTPDSSRVVFVGRLAATSTDDVFAVPIGGGSPYQLNPPLADHETIDLEVGPQLTADSQRAVFLADSGGLANTLYSAVLTRPPDLTATSLEIAENSPIGASAGYVTMTDPDGDPLVLTELSGATDLFSVDEATGEVTLAAPIDYETATSHELTVHATDGIYSDTAVVTVHVTNVNDNEPIVADLNVTVAEDVPVATVLGTLSADDADGDTVSFALAAPDQLFAVTPNGEITTIAALDYETAAAHEFTVTANDGLFTETANVTVTVTDVYEPPPSPEFDDVPATNVFHNDIIWLAEQGITKGCNPPVNDQYCPSRYVTRGQMAAFLHRALDETLTPGPPVEFSDDDTSGFENDIEWLAAVGVTKGCNPPTNDRFCPTDYVTRGQMAAFLDRALNLPAPVTPDLFTDDDDSLFEAQIDRLATAGITRGCNPPTNTLYCPDTYVTREQMAAFLHRALGNG